MTAFLNDGIDPPDPVIEAMSSVTIGAVLLSAVLPASLFARLRAWVAKRAPRLASSR